MPGACSNNSSPVKAMNIAERGDTYTGLNLYKKELQDETERIGHNEIAKLTADLGLHNQQKKIFKERFKIAAIIGTFGLITALITVIFKNHKI